MQYRVTKVFNNNLIFSKNELGHDIVLKGAGIGFQKHKGDLVDSNRIEHIFVLKDDDVSNKLTQLLKQIPDEYLSVVDEIKTFAQEKLHKTLSDNIYITLTDHIYFAKQRLSEGLIFQNQLLWEIKRFYKSEYDVALKAIQIIDQELHIHLPDEEASFIALHIINAEIGGKEIQSAVDITQLIKQIVQIVQYQLKIQFDEDSLSYTRFILHLKFFAQRVLMKQKFDDDVEFLYEQVHAKMPDAFNCALKIYDFVDKKYKYEVSKSEIVYLTIHINRIYTSEH